jgi:SAM-dependent methyltransferase
MEASPADRWQGAEAYEAYIGRWSRPVAARFIDWLAAPAGRSWLDVGCGTGALSASILAGAAPALVVGIDQSADFVELAARRLDDRRALFLVGDATALPLAPAQVDAVVSGLVLNFLPEPQAAITELARVARPGGTVAAYVWDYAEGMEPIRAFWDAAVELAPSARTLDEAVRFPLCREDRLRQLFEPGLDAVETRSIEIEARFRDFDDYWAPFLGGVGPAPGYCASLTEDERAELRALLRARLAPGADGTIAMRARAFGVRGTVR